MNLKTKVRWVDEKRVYVETPQGILCLIPNKNYYLTLV